MREIDIINQLLKQGFSIMCIQSVYLFTTYCTLCLALETEAQRPVDKVLWMNEPDVQMCAYMLRKHGDDYEVSTLALL